MTMDNWMHDVVSMMTEGSITRVKQEFESTSCCSPTPSSGNQIQQIVYSNSQTSPGSPDRQFCTSTTNTLLEICSDSGNQSSMKEDIPRRLCLVCGDTASGFHYGVASCEACKAFFKRTIQGNIEYTCPANNECEINKRRRKACQACRFQKCLLMGMLKEGVRLDRVRGGRQKYRRNPVANAYQMQVLYPSTTTTPTSLEDIKMLEALSLYEPELLVIGNVPNDLLNRDVDDKSLVFENKLKREADVQDVLCIMSDLYDKELVGVISWAKILPGFTDLQLTDQMKLLQVSWAEILTLQLTHRSIPFTGKLNFASDFSLDERLAKECGVADFYYHCVQIVQRLERLSVRKEEYYLLKALALSNGDIRLDDHMMLRKFRDSILSALNDCVYILRHNLAVSHQQQLLLLLPSLRQADHIIRKFWSNVYREGNVIMNKLFVEMLEPMAR